MGPIFARWSDVTPLFQKHQNEATEHDFNSVFFGKIFENLPETISMPLKVESLDCLRSVGRYVVLSNGPTMFCFVT